MATYGRQILLGTSGIPAQVSIDGAPEWKVGGITIDWATVAAASGDTSLPDGVVIPNGQKGLALGTVLAKITASGLYGPADSTAVDGRQTWAPGNIFILNMSVLQTGPLGLYGHPTDNPPVFAGGKVWEVRLQVGTGNQPTLAQLLAAMPRLQPVYA